MPTVRPPNTRRSRGPNHALTRGEDMDERPGDRLSTTDVDESREATEPRSGWARPVVEEEVAGRPAAPADVAVLPEAEPSTHQLPGNGWTDGIAVAEPQPPLDEPVEPRHDEPTELDRPPTEAAVEEPIELVAVDSRQEYRARWDAIQTGFVDDPAQAVREADHLVADVMERLAATFAEERGRLEERWSGGHEDTERLRVALQRYRQFFGLLLKG